MTKLGEKEARVRIFECMPGQASQSTDLVGLLSEFEVSAVSNECVAKWVRKQASLCFIAIA